jgi:hypothetical protein
MTNTHTHPESQGRDESGDRGDGAFREKEHKIADRIDRGHIDGIREEYLHGLQVASHHADHVLYLSRGGAETHATNRDHRVGILMHVTQTLFQQFQHANADAATVLHNRILRFRQSHNHSC